MFFKKNNTFSFLRNLARLLEVACVLFNEFQLYKTCFFDLSIKKSQYFPVRFMYYLDKNKGVQNHKDNSYSNKCMKFYYKKNENLKEVKLSLIGFGYINF